MERDRQARDGVSEQELRSLIQRAVEIDSTLPNISIDEVRAIANELGISDAALLKALSERQGPVRDVSVSRSLGRAMVGALPFGFFLGSYVSWNFDYTSWPGDLSIILMGLSSLALVLMSRRGRRLGKFQLGHLGLWVGYIVGWQVWGTLHLAAGSDLWFVPWQTLLRFAAYWAGSAVIGGLIVGTNDNRSGSEHGTSVGQKVAAVFRRTIDWLFKREGIKNDHAFFERWRMTQSRTAST